MKNLIKQEKEDVFGILSMIKHRKFKGYTGLAVKNTIYDLMKTVTAKLGSLVLMIFLARVLLPELFGYYSLAIATILFFVSFTDLGIKPTLIKFVSRCLRRNKNGIAKSYVIYLAKIKFYLVVVVLLVLSILSKFIAEVYYQKPLFLALLAGSIYILSIGFIDFLDSIFQSVNNFKHSFYKELFFQISRIILIPTVIIVAFKYPFSTEVNIFLIISTLSLCYLLTLGFFFFLLRRNISFLKVKPARISKKEKRKINRFMLPLTVTALSGVFFGYLDMLMLGRFVLAEYIGYYHAAFSLMGTFVPLISFSVVLYPLFSRISGKRLERALKKSVNITLLLGIISMFFIFILAPQIIQIIFGKEYISAAPLLRIFSLFLISAPLISMYSSYTIAKGRPGVVAKLLIISTLLNLVLNFILITGLLKYSQNAAIIGAGIATLISRYVHLAGLILARKFIIN